MKHASPIEALLAFCVLGALAACIAGFIVLAAVLAVAALGSLARRRVHQKAGLPRPTITYLAQPSPHEPLILLQRGQTAIVPWPHPLQVLLSEGTRCKSSKPPPSAFASSPCEPTS